MTDAIDWIRESAKFLVADRPDIYDESGAIEELSTSIDELRAAEIEPVGSMMFTSYLLTRVVEDGIEEFILSRKLSALLLCEEEEDVRAIAFDKNIGLPKVWEALDSDDDLW